MQLMWLGLALTVVLVVGCEANIDGGASFSAQSGGDMMDDADDGDGVDDGMSGRATAGGSGRSEDDSGSGAGSSESGGAGAEAGSAAEATAGTGTSGPGAAMPPEEMEPNPDVGGPYDLGTLPPGFTIEWPAEPVITREVEVRTREEFESAAAVAGTRILVRQDIPGNNGYVQTGASDLDIRVDPGVTIDATLGIGRGRQRIRVLGGNYRGVMMAVLPDTVPLSEDVMLDGVTINAQVSSAFTLRGRRIAILRSTATANLFSVFADAMTGEPNTDIILAGNVLHSIDEATIRLISVTNSVTVDNRLSNMGKHNYRVHGRTGQSYAARNTFITSGTMLATMPGDMLAEAWFDSNVFYHTTPDLFHPEAAAVTMLHARDNIAYTDVWGCFYCAAMPTTWDFENNQIMPYRPPP